MVYVFILLTVLLTLLYFLSKNKFNEIIKPLDKKTYALKKFMPIALYIMEKVKYKYDTGYDQSLQLKFGELFGNENSRYYLKIHWANKISLILIMLLIITIIGSAMDEFDSSFIFFSIASLVLGFYLTDKEVNQKLNKRRLRIQIDFPDFINKLILLINAGMTMSQAMKKVVLNKKDIKDSVLYDELKTMMLEIKAGKPEVKAYEDFAKRCRIPEVNKFTSVIIQNLKKGNAELVSVLRLQVVECWEMRKNIAKKLGEEASTKLLFPMMIMLLAILLIVLAPSIMQLQGF